MRSIKFYMSMVIIIGFLSVYTTSFAGERYSINVDSIKKAAQNGIWDVNGKIAWTAKVRNTTEKSQTYEVKVDFLNNDNENIQEISRIATINPHETKAVNYEFTLSTSKFRKIDSGYITVSKVEKNAKNEQTLTAKIDKRMNSYFNRLSNSSVLVDYSVKLKNNTDKAMIRNVTVAFLDAENNHVKSETRKASFNAGESKLITYSLELKPSDAARIATGHVTIN